MRGGGSDDLQRCVLVPAGPVDGIDLTRRRDTVAEQRQRGSGEPEHRSGFDFLQCSGIGRVRIVLANSGGTTEYTFTQALVNNSGQVWSGFRFELGHGAGSSFSSASASSGLDFDLLVGDPAPVSSQFTVLDHQGAVLDWSGATVPSIGSVVFSFAVDVPDGLSAFHPSAQNRFTLRATPVLAAAPIPEPATVLLLSGGLALVGWRHRRRA